MALPNVITNAAAAQQALSPIVTQRPPLQVPGMPPIAPQAQSRRPGFLNSLQQQGPANILTLMGLGLLSGRQQPGQSALGGIGSGLLSGLGMFSAMKGQQAQAEQQQQLLDLKRQESARSGRKLELAEEASNIAQKRFELDEARFEKGEPASATFRDAQRFTELNGGDLQENYMRIKQASAAQTKIMMPAAEKRANQWRELGTKASFGRRQEIATNAARARDENAKLDQLMSLSDEFSAGPVNELLDEGRRWLQNAGLEISPERQRAMAAAATTESLSNELSIAYLEGFKGPTTDFEFGIAKQIAGGAGSGKAGNQARWQIARSMNDYQELKEDFFWDREQVARDDPEFDGERFMKETEKDFYKAHPPREFFQSAADAALPQPEDGAPAGLDPAAQAQQMSEEELKAIAGGQ